MATSSRRNVLKTIAGTAAVLTSVPTLAQRMESNEQAMGPALKGRINHSVCRWCYDKIPLEELCKSAKAMGIQSVELTGPDEWATLKKHGLTSAMPWGAGKGIVDGSTTPSCTMS
jgi:hydroxypyruvate isomerase